MRGEGTVMSDIDLVVVYGRLDHARRESFFERDFPVEVFVHDLETLEWFMRDDIRRGRPTILNIIAEGWIVGRDDADARMLQRDTQARVGAGPALLNPEELAALRYLITDAIDDLRGVRSIHEIRAIGTVLYPHLAELCLRGRGHWNGSGKWIPRLLCNLDAALAETLFEAFEALLTTGASNLVIALAESELARHGGRLFEGDKRAAPSSARICKAD